MAIRSDVKTIYHLAMAPIRGTTHAERLENFYQGQAGDYDAFRKRLLHGRDALVQDLPLPEGGTWVDLGGGTGENIESAGASLTGLRKAYIVDLAPSLLGVARDRIARNGWANVEAVEADATEYSPEEGEVDVVTFSYSLTMMPNWFSAIDNAFNMLKPGGLIGVVDFYVGRKYPEPGFTQHNWWTRTFWPAWFANDNVYLSSDHVHYLHDLFQRVSLTEAMAPVPYMPVGNVPYYTFVGRKPDLATEEEDD